MRAKLRRIVSRRGDVELAHARGLEGGCWVVGGVDRVPQRRWRENDVDAIVVGYLEHLRLSRVLDQALDGIPIPAEHLQIAFRYLLPQRGEGPGKRRVGPSLLPADALHQQIHLRLSLLHHLLAALEQLLWRRV